jgi:polar amino acid transport system substrate-binding protein/glutamate/aspartate transport system substrate-binding protein
MVTVSNPLRFLLCAVLASAIAGAAAAASPTLDRIKSTGIVTFAYRDGAAPFSFKARNGRPQGYSVELCEKVAAAIGKTLALPALKIEWRPVDAASRLDAVMSGRADAECGTTTITLGRMEQVDYSVPIFVDGGSVLVQGKDRLARLVDLKGKRIAVIPGTTTEPALQKALKVIEVTAELVPVKTSAEGVALLLAGKADAFASDRVVLAGIKLAQPADELEIMNNDFSFEPYGLVLRRDDPDFRLAVNRALVGMYKSGEIDAVYVKWLAPLGRPGPLLNAMFYLNSLPD